MFGTPLRREAKRPARGRTAGAGRLALVAGLVVLLAATAGAALADRAYVIEPGDTLYALAARFGTTVGALRSDNRLSGDLLKPGEVLRIPGATQPGYHTTVVQAGETLADVAARVGRTAATLASANPVLARTGARAGAPVSVPPADGVTVVATSADTLDALAGRAGVPVAELAQVNGLDAGTPLQPGQPVLLPGRPASAGGAAAGGAAAADGAVAADTPAADTPAADTPAAHTPDTPAADTPDTPAADPRAAADAPAAAPAVYAAAAVGGAGTARTRLEAMQNAALLAAVVRLPEVRLSVDSFQEPVAGRLSSPFGWRSLSVDGNHFHAGIDLAVPMGTPVHAARDGTVVEARWDGTYGNVVFLDHGDGSQTRYAHLSRIAVRDGASVRQGDVLGYAGSTGWSTGPHVHFELRFDGRAVDPLDYLRGAVAR